MFEAFYGLSANPFRLSPDQQFRFSHRSFSRAKAYLKYAVDRAEGFAVITGQPGTGKTTLVNDLLSELDETRVLAANLVSNQLQAEELLRMLGLAYGLHLHTSDKATLLNRIKDYVLTQQTQGRRALVIIDEAQNLPPGSMEELRLLSNLQTEDRSLFQIFLLGQEELRGRVQAPGMEQLQQRIIATCRIEPMSREETQEYVEHRLKTVGWKEDPALEPEIYPAIHRLTGGVPRRINHFFSRLMLHGGLEEKHRLGEDDVWIVASELFEEQLLTLKPGETLDGITEDLKLENKKPRKPEVTEGAESATEARAVVPEETKEKTESEGESITEPSVHDEEDVDAGGRESVPEIERQVAEQKSTGSWIAELLPEEEPVEHPAETREQTENLPKSLPETDEQDESDTVARAVASRVPASQTAIIPEAGRTKRWPRRLGYAAGLMAMIAALFVPSGLEPGRFQQRLSDWLALAKEKWFAVTEIIPESGEQSREIRQSTLEAEPAATPPADPAGVAAITSYQRVVSGQASRDTPKESIAASVQDRSWQPDQATPSIRPGSASTETDGKEREEESVPAAPESQPDDQRVASGSIEDQETSNEPSDRLASESEVSDEQARPSEPSVISLDSSTDGEVMPDRGNGSITSPETEIALPDQRVAVVASEPSDADPSPKKFSESTIPRVERDPPSPPPAEAERKLDVPETDSVRQILFSFDSTWIDPAYHPLLDEVIRILSGEDTAVRIRGFTDRSGEQAYNQRLSLRRAQAVAEYLINRGVGPERILTEGQGEALQSNIADKDEQEARLQARRVDLIIVSSGSP